MLRDPEFDSRRHQKKKIFSLYPRISSREAMANHLRPKKDVEKRPIFAHKGVSKGNSGFCNIVKILIKIRDR